MILLSLESFASYFSHIWNAMSNDVTDFSFCFLIEFEMIKMKQANHAFAFKWIQSVTHWLWRSALKRSESCENSNCFSYTTLLHPANTDTHELNFLKTDFLTIYMSIRHKCFQLQFPGWSIAKNMTFQKCSLQVSVWDVVGVYKKFINAVHNLVMNSIYVYMSHTKKSYSFLLLLRTEVEHLFNRICMEWRRCRPFVFPFRWQATMRINERYNKCDLTLESNFIDHRFVCNAISHMNKFHTLSWQCLPDAILHQIMIPIISKWVCTTKMKPL